MSCSKYDPRPIVRAAVLALIGMVAFSTAGLADINLIDDTGALTGTPGAIITIPSSDFADELWTDGTYTPDNTSPVFPPAYVPVYQNSSPALQDGWIPVRDYPNEWYENPYDVLGEPNRQASTNKYSDPNALSLGKNWYHNTSTDPLSGSVTVRFDTPDALQTDGTTLPDLLLFEVGSDIEGVIVEISTNGVDWYEVGNFVSNLGAVAGHPADSFRSVGGPADVLPVTLDGDPGASDENHTSVFGVDIDNLSNWTTPYVGDLATAVFPYIRIYDNPDSLTGISNRSYGADIDAIAAVNLLQPVIVPEPATLTMLVAGGLMMGLWWRRRRK